MTLRLIVRLCGWWRDRVVKRSSCKTDHRITVILYSDNSDSTVLFFSINWYASEKALLFVMPNLFSWVHQTSLILDKCANLVGKRAWIRLQVQVSRTIANRSLPANKSSYLLLCYHSFYREQGELSTYLEMPSMPLLALHLRIAVVLLVSKQHQHNHVRPYFRCSIDQDNRDGIGCHDQCSLSNEVKTSCLKILLFENYEFI